MKNLIIGLTILIACQGCSHRAGNTRLTESSHINKYTLTVYQDKFDPSTNKFKPDNRVDSIQSDNDTVAYLSALKGFYEQKILERKKFNYGEPKSFIIVDSKGIDLTIKLSDRVVNGLRNQVENEPNVKQMIEDYRKDSL